MKEIHTNLFIGTDADCRICSEDSGFSIVHACQSCYLQAVNFRTARSPKHPHHLVFENASQLYLNLLDTPEELVSKSTNPLFKGAIEFIKRELQNKKVLIHCNLGMSRSPSIGLVYLARTGVIPKNSYKEAYADFLKLYPKYYPGTGITLYLINKWNILMNKLGGTG